MWGQWDSCVCVIVVCVCESPCVPCMLVLYWLLRGRGGKTRLDQWKDGRTEDNTPRERPEEWKRHKMSHISIWDRRRDLFKLCESSFLSDACVQRVLPPLWMLNDPCTKYSPHVRVLVGAVFLSETRTIGRGVFPFFLIPCSLACLLSSVSALQSNQFGQSAGRPGNHGIGRRTATTWRPWTRWRGRTWRAPPCTWASQVGADVWFIWNQQTH